jgi:hypothetical protein
MTLLDIIEANPDLFRTDQTWYAEEDFVSAPMPRGTFREPPRFTLFDGEKPREQYANRLPLAVTLAHLYVQHPEAEIWTRYLWTGDTDAEGQRVFMGVNEGKMEIHRHLHLTDRFGCPAWQ